MPIEESELILIVEDEPKLAEVLQDYLQQAGYRTDTLMEGTSVIEWIRHNNPDLVLLDLMLPGRNGMDICRDLRSFSTVPVIMMTARVEEIDRLLGLEMGADDYVCKPYSPREVVARVKAVLRRVQVNTETAADTFGVTLNPEAFTASYNGTPIELTPVEFRLLEVLMSQPGRVYSRASLMDAIYTDNRVVTDRTVDSHVKNLRRKLQAVMPAEEIIRSIYGVGYKLEL